MILITGGTGYIGSHTCAALVKAGHQVVRIEEDTLDVSNNLAPRIGQVAIGRPGDVARCFAAPGRANRLPGWRAKRGMEEMCHDAWRWLRKSLEVAK